MRIISTRLSTAIEPIEPRLLLSAGQLDPHFGDDGVATIAMPGGAVAELHDLEALPDGRILGVGTSNSRLIFARLRYDGGPDPSFGGASGAPVGVVDTGLPGSAGLIEWVGKGRFVFASGSRLIRFNSDGSVDPTFTQDEPSRYKFSFNAADIHVQSDGKILLAGRYKQTATKSGHFAVARLNANGRRDRSFGVGGVSDFFQHTNSPATAVRAMRDGSVFVAGGINHGYPTDLDEYTRQDMICMKLRPDGSADTSYGTSGVGKMTGRFFAGATMRASLAPDGTATITAAGDDLKVYRLTPSGVPDATFGTNGSTAAVNFNGSIFRPTLQNDGGLLLTFRDFTTPDDTQREDRLLRFAPTGPIDTSFGTNGVANLPAAYQPVVLNAASIANDGSILVAGRAVDGGLLVARFWSDDAPAAQLHASNLKGAGTASHRFHVSVRDDVAVAVRTLDSSDFRVVAPDGTTLRASFVGIDARRAPTLAGVNLKLAAPGGAWDAADNGPWRVRLLPSHVFDTDGHAATGRLIGTFWVRVA